MRNSNNTAIKPKANKGAWAGTAMKEAEKQLYIWPEEFLLVS